MSEQAVKSGIDPTQPGHALQRRLTGWKLVAAVSGLMVTVLVVSAATVVGFTIGNLASSIQTVDLPGKERPQFAGIGEIEGGFNVLIVGSDTRLGQGDQFGDVDSELNDVNLLVHVSENHDHATVMSMPRDMLVDIPSCPQSDGSESEPQANRPLNSTWSVGGLPCVVATVEQLTGLSIGYAGVMTFTGVAQLSTAVGGVEVCVDAPVFDKWSGLNLPEAGWHELEGGQALAFLRTRKSVGDGSDLARISSQQVYMSALVRKILEDDVLNDIGKLYGLAQVAANTMVLSSSLGSLDVMVSMARALRNIPPERITFIQFPVLDAPEPFAGKVIPDPVLATAVLDKILADEFFGLDDDSVGRGSEVVSEEPETVDATPAPETPTQTEEPSTEDSGGDQAPADSSETTAEPEPTTDNGPTEEPEVISGLVGQTAGTVTCAAVR